MHYRSSNGFHITICYVTITAVKISQSFYNVNEAIMILEGHFFFSVFLKKRQALGGNSQNFLGKFVRFFVTLRCF